ncbi:MAG: GFA family protein, partial [Gammaproteobacteria bacterium]|nr:GFA family protein [Gammaproteobacteria bacterium]
ISGDPNGFEWNSGEELVGRYELPEANHFATCFCKNCGSSLPWITQSKRGVVIPAGTLDVDPGIRPQHNIFCNNKAPWYVGFDDLKKYEELPVK